MKFDSAHLTAFAAVLQEGGFEAAARRLNLTTSAVSQRIRALEDRVGRVLINRKSPGEPTAAGRILVTLADRIALLEADAWQQLTPEDGRAQPVRLPIAVNADSLAGWFFTVADQLPPGTGLLWDIHAVDQDHTGALLRAGTVMAAIGTEAAPVQGCRVEALGAMRYLAVASPALARRHFAQGVDPSAFERAPMLVFDRKDRLEQRFMREICGNAPHPPRHVVPSAECLLELATRGTGWCMATERLARPAIEAGRLVELLPGRVIDLPLYWQYWAIGSPLLTALTGAVRRAARQHLRALPG